MNIKTMKLDINNIIPQQHYLSAYKYNGIVDYFRDKNDYGDIWVIKHRNRYFSVDGHHRLLYLYKNGVKEITVKLDMEDNENELYKTLADEALELGFTTIADLEHRMIEDHEIYIRKWIDKCQLTMLTEEKIEKYVNNPCQMSALPLYKEIRQDYKGIEVIHDSKFDETKYTFKSHQRFFRLKHDLKEIELIKINGFSSRIVNIDKDIDDIIRISNESYDNLRINKDKIYKLITDRVYNPKLWIFIYDEVTNENVALGISHYDNTVGELELDWIQVLPGYRGKGLGKYIVSKTLLSKPRVAKFCTVSGNMENHSSPEKLYRSMNFKGNDIWHILKK